MNRGDRRRAAVASCLITGAVGMFVNTTVALGQTTDPSPMGQSSAASPPPALLPATPPAATPPVDSTTAPPAVVIAEPPKTGNPAVDMFKSFNIGVGLRTAAEVKDKQVSFADLNIRPYISGQVHQYFKFTANLDSNTYEIPVAGGGSQTVSTVQLLDAIAQFEPDDLFHIWLGRMLPPGERQNLSGPYYQNAWYYPLTVNGYHQIYAGRDNGAVIWGQVNGGKFKYSVGATGLPTPTKKLEYSGRLVYNFLDPEPGYYNNGTYYGTKDILAIGVAGHYQKDGAADGATGTKDYAAFTVDALFEKRLGGAGTVTLEGAYYDFKKSDEGSSFFVIGSYLLPEKTGIGQFQPNVRWQKKIDEKDTIDAGLNYIIDGHNLRLTANWRHEIIAANGASEKKTSDAGLFGIQIQK